MKTLFGDSLSQEALDDMHEMTNVLEEITAIKQAAKQQGQKADEAELQDLRSKFKKIALEVFKEMYGFYNTETGGGPGGVLGEMLGNEPLSAQEKRMLEK